MQKKEIQKKCIEDPLFFGMACMPQLFNVKAPPFHREIVNDILYEKARYLNFIAPRGHAKSSVTAILIPLWRIFCYNLFMGLPAGPKFTLLVSKSRGHTVNLITTIKNQLEYNPHIRALWGYQGAASAYSWREDYIKTCNGNILVGRGMEQQVRGLLIDGMRPDYIVLDDAEDEENTRTRERIEGNLRKVLQGLVPAGSNDVRIVNIGTPQTQRCLVFTLKELNTWKTRQYSAIINKNGVESALWPEMKSLEWLRKEKNSLEHIGRVSVFYKEYMCQVIGDSDQLFREDYIQYHDFELERDSEGRAYLKGDDKEFPVTVFMGIDPASSLTATADYTAILALAMDEKRNVYILDYLKKRMQPMDGGKAAVRWIKRFKPDKCQVETVQFQEMFRQYIVKELGMFVPGLNIKNNPRQGKTQRIEGLQPIFAMKRVFVRQSHTDLIDELLLFPRAKHDDLVDALYYAHKGSFPPYHSIVNDTSNKKDTRNTANFDWMVV